MLLPPAKLLAFQKVLSGSSSSPHTTADNIGIQPLANCQDVRFTVNATATNRNLTLVASTDVEKFRVQVLEDKFPRIEVSGEQILTGLYCAPTVENKNNSRLIFATHMITSNRNYWTALGGSLGFHQYVPEKYSWVDYSTSQGYAFLALDRLGAGRSSQPDPVNEVQAPYEIALMHDLVEQIKANGTGQLPHAFNDLTYASVSYGSVLGNLMSEVYPKDFKTIILQGFTYSIIESLTSSFKWNVAPASGTDPTRFKNLPQGYLQATNRTGMLNSFFDLPARPDSFDDAAATRFFAQQDTVTLGQFVSTYLNVTHAPAYKGRILILTGDNDRAFCSSAHNPFARPVCGPKVKDTAKLYPQAEYNWYQPDNTGHAPNFHYSNPGNMLAAHEFLAGKRVGRRA